MRACSHAPYEREFVVMECRYVRDLLHPGTAPAAPESTGLFSYFRSGLSGYVPLRSAERSNEEEAYISLSHWERYV